MLEEQPLPQPATGHKKKKQNKKKLGQLCNQSSEVH